MKKNLVLATLVFAVGTMAMAQQKVSLYAFGQEAPVWAQSLSEVQKIVVGGPTLKVVGVDGTVSPDYQLKSVRKLVFAPDDITGIRRVAPVLAKQHVAIKGDMLEVIGWDASKTVNAVIYTANGSVAMNAGQWSGQSISTADLPKGVYVFVAGNKSFRFVK